MLNQQSINDIVTGVSDVNVPHIKAYVCGFLFGRDSGGYADWVALISKKRPSWQRGRLNGIGGAIEAGETPDQAMIREFNEETGVTIPEWRCFAILRHGSALIYMFTAESDYVELQQKTDEFVLWKHVTEINTIHTINNLRWLIPLAMSGSKEVVVVADDAPLPEQLT